MFFLRNFGILCFGTVHYEEIQILVAPIAGSIGGSMAAQLTFLSIPAMLVVLVSWLVKSVYHQLIFTAIPENMCKIIWKYTVEYQNTKEKI